MQTDNSSTSNNIDTEVTDEDSTIEKKKKLLREIQELKHKIEQCERKMNTLCFENVEKHISESQNLEISLYYRHIPNVEVDLQNDLYNFAGFRIIKFGKEEIVVNFTSTIKEEQKDIYAIQIFIRNKKGHLGKWIMPMSIDMNDILIKTPINKSEDLILFLKNCKHYIDCYTIRQEQFLSLKEHISHMKHCAVHSNMAYTHIILELYGVYDRENDSYINLIIYLLYHLHYARPYKINIDSEKDKLSDNLRQQLKMCLSPFETLDLQTAFDKILIEDSAFTWIRIDDSDSPLELSDTNSSFLSELQLIQERSLKKSKKRREPQKEWNKKKRQKNTSTKITLSKNNEKDSQTQAKTHTNSSRKISIREKETEVIPSTSKQQEKAYRYLPETPSNKPKNRFKQTKLNFKNNQTTNSVDSNPNKNSSFKSKLHNKPDKKKSKIALRSTSTPYNVNKKISLSSLIDDITEIEPSKQIANKFDSENHSKNDSESDSENDS